jgi:hypothetical protein
MVSIDKIGPGASGNVTEDWFVGPYSTSGTSFILGTACADGGLGSQTVGYSATVTTLTLFLENYAVATLTLQTTSTVTDGGTDATLGDGNSGDASFACVQPSNPAPVVTQT